MAQTLQYGLRIDSTEPVDSRFTVANQAARYALPDSVLYEGLLTFQQDTNEYWYCSNPSASADADKWTEWTGGAHNSTITLSPGTGLTGGGNFTTDQDSNETITLNVDAGLAEDKVLRAGEDLNNGDLLFISADKIVGRTGAQLQSTIVTKSAVDAALDVAGANATQFYAGDGTFTTNISANNSTIRVQGGTGLTGEVQFTTNQSSNVTGSINADVGIANGKLLQVDESGGATSGEWARFTSNGIQSIPSSVLASEVVTNSTVDTALGISSGGSATMYLNQQGNFVSVTSSDGSGYDTIKRGSTTLAQQDTLNFSDDFAITNDTTNSETDVTLSTNIVRADATSTTFSGESISLLRASDAASVLYLGTTQADRNGAVNAINFRAGTTDVGRITVDRDASGAGTIHFRTRSGSSLLQRLSIGSTGITIDGSMSINGNIGFGATGTLGTSSSTAIRLKGVMTYESDSIPSYENSVSDVLVLNGSRQIVRRNIPAFPTGNNSTQHHILQTTGAAGSETYSWVVEDSTDGYDRIQLNGTNLTQRPTINFSTDFEVVDNSGNTRTNIALGSNVPKIASNNIFTGLSLSLLNASAEPTLKIGRSDTFITDEVGILSFESNGAVDGQIQGNKESATNSNMKFFVRAGGSTVEKFEVAHDGITIMDNLKFGTGGKIGEGATNDIPLEGRLMFDTDPSTDNTRTEILALDSNRRVVKRNLPAYPSGNGSTQDRILRITGASGSETYSWVIPSTGGTNVTANPGGTGSDLSSVSIGGTTYLIPSGGTTVTANPGGTGTSLTTIGIGGTTYSISGGGGGGGSSISVNGTALSGGVDFDSTTGAGAVTIAADGSNNITSTVADNAITHDKLNVGDSLIIPIRGTWNSRTTDDPNANGEVRFINGGGGNVAAGANMNTVRIIKFFATDSNGVDLSGPLGELSSEVTIEAHNGTASILIPRATISISSGLVTVSLTSGQSIGHTVGTLPSSVSTSWDITVKKEGRLLVTHTDIQDREVISTKLADGAVTADKIFDGAVGTAKIADGSVTGAKLGNVQDMLRLQGIDHEVLDYIASWRTNSTDAPTQTETSTYQLTTNGGALNFANGAAFSSNGIGVRLTPTADNSEVYTDLFADLNNVMVNVLVLQGSNGFTIEGGTINIVNGVLFVTNSTGSAPRWSNGTFNSSAGITVKMHRAGQRVIFGSSIAGNTITGPNIADDSIGADQVDTAEIPTITGTNDFTGTNNFSGETHINDDVTLGSSDSGEVGGRNNGVTITPNGVIAQTGLHFQQGHDLTDASLEHLFNETPTAGFEPLSAIPNTALQSAGSTWQNTFNPASHNVWSLQGPTSPPANWDEWIGSADLQVDAQLAGYATTSASYLNNNNNNRLLWVRVNATRWAIFQFHNYNIAETEDDALYMNFTSSHVRLLESMGDPPAADTTGVVFAVNCNSSGNEVSFGSVRSNQVRTQYGYQELPVHYGRHITVKNESDFATTLLLESSDFLTAYVGKVRTDRLSPLVYFVQKSVVNASTGATTLSYADWDGTTTSYTLANIETSLTFSSTIPT